MQSPSPLRHFGKPLPRLASRPWETLPLDVVAKRFSPQVALANYWGLPWAPFSQAISVELTDPVATTPTVTFGVNEQLQIVSVVESIVLQVDAPNLFPDRSLQPFTNWFFARQSGINATLKIYGKGAYLVAPNFVPIASLVAMVNESWPSGWVLHRAESPQMQFSPSIPLSAPPVTVSVTFRMWQPAEVLKMVGMTDDGAVRILRDAGIISREDARMIWCVE